MKIEKLLIKNYKGFENCELNLRSDINVFVGVNGAGKTSIIELAATFLNQFVDKLCGNTFVTRFSDFLISPLDINIKASETNNRIDISAPWASKARDLNKKGVFLSWFLNKSINDAKNNYEPLNSYIKSYQEYLSESPEANIPIFRYYPCHRLMDEKGKGKATTKRYLIPQFKAYEKAFSKTMAFDNFIEWFVEEENKENREKIKRQDFSYSMPSLNVIREALRKAFTSFSGTAYSKLRVETREFNLKTNEKSSLVIDKNDTTYNLKQLSEGEKIVTLMIADIAYMLSVANPSAKSPLEGTGIVLIDEIDLHLHPAWQRQIIPCLQETFPNIQLLITTHSPQVLSMVNHSNIFIIEDFKIVNIPPKTLGKDANSLLWDVFAVKERPDEAMEDFKELYDLIDEPENLEKAQLKIKELAEKYGENDQEIVRARLQLEYLTLGK